MKLFLQKYSVMINNTLYLFLLKGVAIILPIFVFPYLIYKLGDQQYGKIMWAFAISEIFIVFIKFGFDTLIVKVVSENRNKKEILSNIISYVTFLKTILFIAVSIVLIFLLQIDKFFDNLDIFVAFAFFIFFESMFPVWYFQGIENMKYIAIVTALSKMIFAIGVFIFVKQTSDYIIVPILYSATSFIAFIIGYYVMVVKHKLSLNLICLKKRYFSLKDCFFIFLSNVVTMLRTRLLIILIENYIGHAGVGYFDLSLRVVNTILSPFHILTQVVYPHIALTRNILFVKKILLFLFFTSFGLFILFFFGADMLIKALNINVLEFKILFQILILTVPIGAISFFLSNNILIIFNKIDKNLLIVFISFLIFLLSLVCLNKNSLNSYAYSLIIYSTLELAFRFFLSFKIIFKTSYNK
ncbi:oligosaccharide flippase family protein [Campylobacter suis]|uniref:Flippase n=1 Tax=Campylobacter suis TaxID=2790657 RepID=A0ABN7K7F6_9BACT|nr:oligosaccharide flippase family protein [Campylobacter suis]CAD7287303.1 hypothetical protein LMG8286_00922 [Campylobacter suis]